MIALRSICARGAVPKNAVVTGTIHYSRSFAEIMHEVVDGNFIATWPASARSRAALDSSFSIWFCLGIALQSEI
jgi:hypothetical protein